MPFDAPVDRRHRRQRGRDQRQHAPEIRVDRDALLFVYEVVVRDATRHGKRHQLLFQLLLLLLVVCGGDTAILEPRTAACQPSHCS
jgi:hypothetical protein